MVADDVELADASWVGVVVDGDAVTVNSSRVGINFALELRERHLDAVDPEGVVRVVVEAQACPSIRVVRTRGRSSWAGAKHLVGRVVPEDHSGIGEGAGHWGRTRVACVGAASELGAECALRAHPVLTAADGDLAVGRRVVVAEDLGGRRRWPLSRVAEVDLSVVVEVLPHDDAVARHAAARVNGHGDRPARRDRLIDDAPRRTDRAAVDGGDLRCGRANLVGLLVTGVAAAAVVVERECAIRVADDVRRAQKRDGNRACQAVHLEGVRVLAVARNRCARLIGLVGAVGRRDGDSGAARTTTTDRPVLVVALRVDPVAGRADDEVTIEPIGACRRPRRDLDVVREGREVAWGDRGLRRCRVCGGREPAARPRRLCRGDVTRHLVCRADREVYLRARARDPARRTGVREEHRERAGVTGLERQECAFKLVGRVVARRCRLRDTQVHTQRHAQRKRCRADRGSDSTHSSFLSFRDRDECHARSLAVVI